jgi:hypothetical protein
VACADMSRAADPTTISLVSAYISVSTNDPTRITSPTKGISACFSLSSITVEFFDLLIEVSLLPEAYTWLKDD